MCSIFNLSSCSKSKSKQMDNNCCISNDSDGNGNGPGYASPAEAMKASREKLIFVTCANTGEKPDMIATIDVDPQSKTYSQVVCQLDLPNIGDEVHHTGWNACSSCFGNPNSSKRTHLIVPCLNSNRIYIIDTSDPLHLKIQKVIEPEALKELNVSFPHTSHCLADGTIMITTLGDAKGDNQGNFITLDGKTFDVVNGPSKWENTNFAYDYWYQPRHNVMISTEWGSPNKIKGGFDPSHVAAGAYGKQLHIWNWTAKKLKQSLTLEGPEGLIPLEVRFMHEPSKCHAFVCTALGSSIWHLYRENDGDDEFKARLAVAIPNKRVEGWMLPEMPSLVTDIILSMDDRFLYLSNWLHGDIRMYNITDPFNLKLVGQCFIGGSIHTESGVRVTEDKEMKDQPPPTYNGGLRVEGGAQMLQLSLDGKRLYVTTSLYSIWDKQFYPQLAKGALMLMLDVDTEKGGLTLNKQFHVDFSKLPNGPFLAHEMRYQGGDCTSDIWI